MSRWGRVVGVLGVLSLGLGSSPVAAADASASVLFSNSYIWRGITFNDSGVSQFSLDVGEDVGSVPVSFNVWGNMDLGTFDGAVESGKFQEIDLTLTVGLPAGFAVGYIEYIFPTNAEAQSVPGTRELFVGWSRDSVVSPAVTFYYDVDQVQSFYSTLSLGWSRPLSDGTSLNLGALGAVAGEDFALAAGGTKGGLFNYDLSASLSHQATERLGLSAVIGWAGSLDEAVLPEQSLGFYFAGGLAVDF